MTKAKQLVQTHKNQQFLQENSLFSTYFKTCATVLGPNHWPTFLPSATPIDAEINENKKYISKKEITKQSYASLKTEKVSAILWNVKRKFYALKKT